MNRLAPFFLILLTATLCSCGLAGRLLQTPVRLIQAGSRTVTGDARDPSPPATAEAARIHGIALKNARYSLD